MKQFDFGTIFRNEYKSRELQELKAQHPGALVLVHPESPRAVQPIKRMLDFSKQIDLPTKGIGNT